VFVLAFHTPTLPKAGDLAGTGSAIDTHLPRDNQGENGRQSG
jgi:hypothetical protein